LVDAEGKGVLTEPRLDGKNNALSGSFSSGITGGGDEKKGLLGECGGKNDKFSRANHRTKRGGETKISLLGLYKKPSPKGEIIRNRVQESARNL